MKSNEEFSVFDWTAGRIRELTKEQITIININKDKFNKLC